MIFNFCLFYIYKKKTSFLNLMIFCNFKMLMAMIMLNFLPICSSGWLTFSNNDHWFHVNLCIVFIFIGWSVFFVSKMKSFSLNLLCSKSIATLCAFTQYWYTRWEMGVMSLQCNKYYAKFKRFSKHKFSLWHALVMYSLLQINWHGENTQQVFLVNW